MTYACTVRSPDRICCAYNNTPTLRAAPGEGSRHPPQAVVHTDLWEGLPRAPLGGKDRGWGLNLRRATRNRRKIGNPAAGKRSCARRCHRRRARGATHAQRLDLLHRGSVQHNRPGHGAARRQRAMGRHAIRWRDDLGSGGAAAAVFAPLNFAQARRWSTDLLLRVGAGAPGGAGALPVAATRTATPTGTSAPFRGPPPETWPAWCCAWVFALEASLDEWPEASRGAPSN